jgi:hypothetical protein
MKKEYDFSKAKKNPYAKRLKRRITIRLDDPRYPRKLWNGAEVEEGLRDMKKAAYPSV